MGPYKTRSGAQRHNGAVVPLCISKSKQPNPIPNPNLNPNPNPKPYTV